MLKLAVAAAAVLSAAVLLNLGRGSTSRVGPPPPTPLHHQETVAAATDLPDPVSSLRSEPVTASPQTAAPEAVPAPLSASPGPAQTPLPGATSDPAAWAELPAEDTAPVFPSPVKGVWVHVLDDTLLTRRSIDTMLDDVAAAGGNTVVVEVARRYDAYYDSAFLPRAGDEGFEPGLDVLATIAEGARERGLSVHAWFTAMPLWTPETAKNPNAVNWTYAEHGPDAAAADTWVTLNEEGEPGEYLDPGHPAVQDLVVATAAELATYDIDAVHLDYLRYPGVEYGYNPTALRRFFAETGRSDIPDPNDVQFSDWRRQQTTAILHRVRDAVTAVNPAVGVSAALVAWGEGPNAARPFQATAAYATVFQPWNEWLADGLLDVAMPMLYFADGEHAAYHGDWLAYVADLRTATGVVTAPGQGSWLNDIDGSVRQLQHAAPMVDGEVLFSYQQTTAGEESQALLDVLKQGLWATTAPAES
ncbi:hypothetical protein BH24ACT15_BH24ACT15_07950 [soil metagenome]